jgi:nucleotide-binding universal stress UspA family protein
MTTASWVVGVDGSPESLTALRSAVEISRNGFCGGDPGALIVVVHVRRNVSMAGFSAMGAAEVSRSLDEQQAQVLRLSADILEPTKVSWNFVVRSGDPARELIKEAEARSAGGIVVGGHRHGTVGAVLLNSVDAALVHHFSGSIIIIRPGEDAGTDPTAAAETAGMA